MKYAFFEIKEDWEKIQILKKLPKKDVTFFSEPLQNVDEKELKQFNLIAVFVDSKCDDTNLKKLPKLKFIATMSTGFDHIDLNYCKKNKIKIASVPYYGKNTVAEFTFGLLINISRQIDKSIQRVKTGTFDYTGLRGFDLAGKTIGILGFGNIGQKFAQMCKGFEMNVIAYDPFAEKLKETADKIGVKLVALEELFKKSQIISLHMPLMKETKHIINKNSLKLMKKGVIILNTSRGGLINTQDLLEALDSEKVSFVAVDVLESEKLLKLDHNILENKNQNIKELKSLIRDQQLIKRINVHVTPHNAFNSIDAMQRIIATTLENISKYKDKKEIENLVKL